ncbi:MAG: DUF4332 domain-containing protein [Anaerolineae bacterium]|nr:MAG: DUF4332 domain-containing protein [Anaerolineae bacterium]
MLHKSALLLAQGGLPTWAWFLIFLLLVVIIVWAVVWNARSSGEDVHVHHEPQAEDDLTRIEGIGPKTAAAFRAAGITTFAQLAASDTATLQEILDANDLRLGDPGTWVEQAKLAAQGDWEALERLQDELKGGRRVA